MASRLIDLISKKTNCTCSTVFLLISKKNLHGQHAFLVFPLPLFCTTTTLFCTTKESTIRGHRKNLSPRWDSDFFWVPLWLILYISLYFLYDINISGMCSCSLLFFTASHFHLAGLIFSPLLWISMFFFLRNSSPLFSITRSGSFSVIHVSVKIKNNAEKDTNLLLFYLSKRPGGHVISFQIKTWVAFELPY